MGRFNGKLVRWCPDCMIWIEGDGNSIVKCPKCGNYPRTAKCNRCGAEWRVYMARYPATCPKCKSPYFNHERIQDRKEVSK